MSLHTPLKKKNKKESSNERFNPFFKTVIKKLLQIKNNGHGKITFYYKDGSMKSMNFSMELFHDETGKERPFGDIIAILNDLKHDFKADNFKVTS